MNLTLISINGKFLADSREVSEMLGKEHPHLMRDIRGYKSILDANPNLDAANFFIESSYIDSQNQTRPKFHLTRLGCDMVANKMTGEKGVTFTATYVTKFEEMERQLNKPLYVLPQTKIEAMEAYLEEMKKNSLLEAKIEADKPLMLFAESLQTSKDSILVADLAKLLKQNGIEMGEKRLFVWLRTEGYLIKSGSEHNMPTQRSMELKIMEVKTGSRNSPDGTIKITRTPKVTGKGQNYFINKFLSLKIAN